MVPTEFMLPDDRVCGLEVRSVKWTRASDAVGSAATKCVTNDYQIGIDKYFNHIVDKLVFMLEL